MEEKNNIKKFELNMKVIDNFEEAMSTSLDEIEELKVTSLDAKSKLLNILSLCSNLKTLIIEADQRLNCDKVMQNVFKPELLENLYLTNVKLPSSKVLKRYSNLKTISLNNIRFCNVKDFFSGIVNPEKIENMTILNSDMANSDTQILEKYSNLSRLYINNVINFNLNDLRILRDNAKISKIEIINNCIPIEQINLLLKLKCQKNVDLSLLSDDGKIINNCRFEIYKNKSKIEIPINELETIFEDVQLFRIDEINLLIDKPTEDNYFIKILKKQKKNTNLSVKDFSCLTVSQAKKVKESLKLETIKFKENGSLKEYNIDSYIEIRTEIDNILNNVSKHVTESEKFLEIYKFLGNKLTVVEEDANFKNGTCLIEDVSIILDNCLQCMNIKSNIISGKELENDKEHSWNQVQIENKWYNVDLGLDIEKIKKNRPEYCLLGDEEFLDTHIPKSGKNNYCGEDFNQKLVNVFFKTGLFSEKLFGSYIELLFEKIKKIFKANKQEEVLLLPPGEDEKHNI